MTPPTRGFGLLETWLAGKRAAMADLLIPSSCRSGHIVDVCCGIPPLFLLRTNVARKSGLDFRVVAGMADSYEGVRLLYHDVRSDFLLPFGSATIQAVTLLAAAEHMTEPELYRFLREARRILSPSGVLIITTPTPQSALLLRILARMGIVSKVEIEDHRRLYSRRELVDMLVVCGFSRERISTGTFEWGCNAWASAGV